MLHAAAILIGYALLAALLMPHVVEARPWIAPVAGAVCAAASLRFGGATGALTRFPRAAAWIGLRMVQSLAGALVVLRAALAGDVTLKPALVKLKTRLDGGDARALLAGMVSAAPGAVAVESDAGGLLVHVMDEDGFDADALAAMEARAQAIVGGGR